MVPQHLSHPSMVHEWACNRPDLLTCLSFRGTIHPIYVMVISFHFAHAGFTTTHSSPPMEYHSAFCSSDIHTRKMTHPMLLTWACILQNSHTITSSCEKVIETSENLVIGDLTDNVTKFHLQTYTLCALALHVQWMYKEPIVVAAVEWLLDLTFPISAILCKI